MTRIDNVLKKLSDLYEFNRKLKTFELKKGTDRSHREDPAKEPQRPLGAVGDRPAKR